VDPVTLLYLMSIPTTVELCAQAPVTVTFSTYIASGTGMMIDVRGIGNIWNTRSLPQSWSVPVGPQVIHSDLSGEPESRPYVSSVRQLLVTATLFLAPRFLSP
jgi:hypothetical protein